MAPKTRESSSRMRKDKAPATGPFDNNRFSSKVHENYFHEITSKKKAIPEVRFDLQPNVYLEIWKQIQRRGWETLCNRMTIVGHLMVQEFYFNAWITYKNVNGIKSNPKN
ncbi:hypothetical protein AHAS_Ahas07G0148900 [Arachis hypogaea]